MSLTDGAVEIKIRNAFNNFIYIFCHYVNFCIILLCYVGFLYFLIKKTRPDYIGG